MDLVPETRVVQAVDFESDDPSFAGTMTMTWELHSTDDGTIVEIKAEDVPVGIATSSAAPPGGDLKYRPVTVERGAVR